MTREQENRMDDYLRREEAARQRRGLESMVKDLNETIERLNKKVDSYTNPTPKKK